MKTKIHKLPDFPVDFIHYNQKTEKKAPVLVVFNNLVFLCSV
jgi:hypothetical protein